MSSLSTPRGGQAGIGAGRFQMRLRQRLATAHQALGRLEVARLPPSQVLGSAELARHCSRHVSGFVGASLPFFADT
jgi:hypothetical protein